MARTTEWEAALRSVGLAPVDGYLVGTRYAGMHDGKRVELTHVGTPVVRVPIEPALDLGLFVQPEGMMTGPKVPSGNREFDGLFTVMADEPMRATDLLTGPIVDSLVLLLARSESAVLSDDVVQVVGDGEQWLRLAVSRAVGIAHHVDGRRSTLKIATLVLGLRPSITRFAIENGLRVEDNPLRVTGTTRSVRVQTLFARDGFRRIAMSLQLHLEDSLGLDLHLTPSRLFTPLVALLPGQRDHRVGDDAFDAAFHVRTSRPDVLARVLDAPLRTALSTCASGSRSFTLDDHGMTCVVPSVDHGPLPLEVLRAGLDAVARLAQAVRAAPAPKPQGPFR